MRFEIEQRFPAPPDVVLAAYTDPALYQALGRTTRIDRPSLLDIDRRGDAVVVRVRYRFTADVPAAALTVIDPNKLTWVDETRYDLSARTSSTGLVPDHYPDRIAGSATSQFVADGTDPTVTRRLVAGDVTVRVPLVGGRVERAIVDGLREHLESEASAVAAHLDAAAG